MCIRHTKVHYREGMLVTPSLDIEFEYRMGNLLLVKLVLLHRMYQTSCIGKEMWDGMNAPIYGT